MTAVDMFVVTTNTIGDGNGLTRADSGTYWAVSFDGGSGSDPTGKTVDVSTDTSIKGTVEKVILKSGSWGVDAAGILILSSKEGTFANNQELQEQGTATKVCDTHIDGTAANFWSNRNEDAAAHTGCINAEADIDDYTDITGDDLTVHCSGGADTAGNLNFGAMSWNSVTWSNDDGTADGVAALGTSNAFDRTLGAVDTTVYRMVMETTYYFYVASFAHTFKNLQVLRTSSGNPSGYFDAAVTIDGCVWESTVAQDRLLRLDNNNITLQNSILVPTSVDGADEIVRVFNGSGVTIVNNVFNGDNNGDGLTVDSGATVANLNNNVFYNVVTDVNNSGTITTAKNNAADADIESDIDTLHPTWTAGVHFVDAPNGNFTPTTSDAGPFQAGIGTALPDTDINGVDRGDGTYSTPDIGPFHLDQPIIYVNLDDPGDDDGRSHAHGHADLATAEAAAQCDRNADNRNFTIYCGSDGTTFLDASNPDFTGWADGSATQRITIAGNEAANTYGRHDGIYDETEWYTLKETVSSSSLVLREDNMTVRGLQFSNSVGDTISVVAGGNEIILEGLYVKHSGSSGSGLDWGGTGTTGNIIRNCIFDGPAAEFTGLVYIRSAVTLDEFVNNAVINNPGGSGFRGVDMDGTITDVSNNVFFNNGRDYKPDGTTTNNSNNATDESSFTDLSTSPIVSIVAGTDYVSATDLTPYYGGKLYEGGDSAHTPSDDINGTSRGALSTPDIGPVHLAAPICYVNLSNSVDGQGHTHAAGHTDLASMEGDASSNLVVDNRNLTILCGTDGGAGEFDDTVAVTVGGWTTGSGNELTIQGNTAEQGINTGAAWSDSFYRLDVTNSIALTINGDFVNVKDIQLRMDTSSSSQQTVDINTLADNHVINFERVRVRAKASASSCRMVFYNDTNGTFTCESCIFEENGGTSQLGAGVISWAGGTANMYNCVLNGNSNTNVGFRESAGTMTCYNCASWGNAAASGDFSLVTNIVNCASDDNLGTNPQDIDAAGLANVFNAHGSGDYRPVTGGILDGNGTATNKPSVDILNVSFANNNIGAFNATVGVGGVVFIPKVIWH
jgi:hypothetical protein